MKPKDFNELRDFLKQRDLENTNQKQNVRLYEISLIKESEETKKGCEKCGNLKNLTIDHIVPQQILLSFNIDPEKQLIPNNLQVLCKACNQFKQNRLDLTNPKTKEILTKILNQ